LFLFLHLIPHIFCLFFTFTFVPLYYTLFTMEREKELNTKSCATFRHRLTAVGSGSIIHASFYFIELECVGMKWNVKETGFIFFLVFFFILTVHATIPFSSWVFAYYKRHERDIVNKWFLLYGHYNLVCFIFLHIYFIILDLFSGFNL